MATLNTFLVAVLLANARCSVHATEETVLLRELQKYLSNVSAKLGVGFGLGLVGDGHHIGIGAGRRSSVTSKIQLPGNEWTDERTPWNTMHIKQNRCGDHANTLYVDS